MERAVQSTYSTLRLRGADRIGVEVPYIPEIVQIPRRQWSQTQRDVGFHLHQHDEPDTSDIPIAEGLGNDNIKTTKVYRHLSNEFTRQIQSPLEGLGL